MRQVWITPDQCGREPQYGSSSYEPADRHNRLLQLLGGTGDPPSWPGAASSSSSSRGSSGLIRLHQDVNVFVSESDAGVSHPVELAAGRQAYLVCIEGRLTVNGVPLYARDAAELRLGDAAATLPLVLAAGGDAGAHFLMIEMGRA